MELDGEPGEFRSARDALASVGPHDEVVVVHRRSDGAVLQAAPAAVAPAPPLSQSSSGAGTGPTHSGGTHGSTTGPPTDHGAGHARCSIAATQRLM